MRILVVIAVLLLAGCTAAPTTTDPNPAPTIAFPEPADPARTPAEACVDPSLAGSSAYLHADGVWFETGIIGEGDTVAVFVPQSGSDYCGFKKFAVLLADHGIQSVLINLCNMGGTLCVGNDVVTSGADAVLAAADQARSNGATRVVAVGASMGGTTVIAASETAKDGRQLDAVADLSGPIEFEGVNTLVGAEDIAIPMFLAVADSDRVVSAYQMKQLADSSSSPDWAQYGGTGHGWDLLFSNGALTDTGSKLVGFISG
jgi:Dienelactone hydrolase family